MRKFAVIALVLILSGTVIYAQDTTRQAGKNKFRKDLNLTTQQRDQLKSINEGYMKSAQEVRTNKALSDPDRSSKLQELSTDRESKVKGVLTPQQFDTWQQQRTVAHERMGKMRKMKDGKGRKDGDKSGRKAIASLGLTTDQEQQLKSIREEYKTQAGTIRNNTSLDDAAKKEQLQTLKKGQQEKIKSTLSAVQFEKYQQARNHRMKRMKTLEKQQDRELPGKTSPGKS